MTDIAGYIDYTLLKPDTTRQEIVKLCEDAVRYGFYAVCVPPYMVQTAVQHVKDTPVKVCTVVGFPFGYTMVSTKVEEAKKAIQEGADEIDMVINIAALKSNDWAYVRNDITTVATACHMQDRIIKVIIETAFLSRNDMIRLAEICGDAGVNYVKTSTGYASRGASVEDVQLLREHLPEKVKIKASGGIKTPELALALIEAGADRLGCSNVSRLVPQDNIV